MYSIKNKELTVQVIDPVQDRALIGSRYCAGGYIFQIADNDKGNLLSGPKFPEGIYNVFDGQGAPEVFETALNQDGANVGGDVLVVGVGIVTRTSTNSPFHVRDNPKVKEFTPWHIEQTPTSIIMKTNQSLMGWELELKREVSIRGRIVKSQTYVKNTGKKMLPIRWFAHPFFPFPKDYTACKFSMPFSLEPNLGYFINKNGYIELKDKYSWENGLYQRIVCNDGDSFKVDQMHPIMGNVLVKADFIPNALSIWANNKAFSFEPFKIASVQENSELCWSISYSF